MYQRMRAPFANMNMEYVTQKVEDIHIAYMWHNMATPLPHSNCAEIYQLPTSNLQAPIFRKDDLKMSEDVRCQQTIEEGARL